MPHTSGNGVRKVIKAITTAVGKLTGKAGSATEPGASEGPAAPDDGSTPESGPDRPA